MTASDSSPADAWWPKAPRWSCAPKSRPARPLDEVDMDDVFMALTGRRVEEDEEDEEDLVPPVMEGAPR